MTDRIEDDTAPNIYELTATVVDGTIRFTGQGLLGDGTTIEVPRGQDSLVRIRDADGHFLHGAEIAGSERPTSWARNTERGLTRRKFEAVDSEVNNIVYAVSTTNSGGVTYGPVIKVRPKG